MTDADLRIFIEGLAAAWRADVSIVACAEGDVLTATLRSKEAVVAEVRRELQPFGVVWRVQAPGGRERLHPSAQGAIRSLGAILAPDQPMARVMFAGGMGDRA